MIELLLCITLLAIAFLAIILLGVSFVEFICELIKKF